MFSKLRRGIKGKEARVLIENFSSLSALQIASYILPLITLPYVAKTIGLKNFGALAFAQAVIVFFKTLTDYGFNYTGIRDISRIRNDKTEVVRIFSAIVYARFILTIISAIILGLLIFIIPQFSDNEKVLWYTFLLVPGYAMFPEWFFQAIEKMKYSAILSVLIKVIFTISIFIFVQEKSDYLYIPLINAIGFTISGIMAFGIIIKRYKYSLGKVNFNDIFNITKQSTNVFLSLIIPNLYSNMSVIFLENMFGKLATGIFDAGNKFINISQQMTNILSRTFYPFLSRRMDKHRFYVMISFFMALAITLILFLGADIIVMLFYEETYNEAITVIRIMAISPIFIFMMNAYSTNYLIINGKENIVRNIFVYASLVGLVLSYILVKEYSYVGAAIAITTTRGIIGVLSWWYAKKYKISNKMKHL